MPTFEVPITAKITAASEAEAEKKKVALETLLQMPMVKTMIASKGVELVIGKLKVKA
jgi:hypothetical protein